MNSESPLWHAKHVVRAFLALIVLLIALVLGRQFLVPDSWGRSGWYRADNVTEQRAFPLRHGGNASCGECHDDILAELTDAGHAGVRCEGCHAPLALHVSDGDKIADMPVRRETSLCVRCHQALDARPTDFPQVHPREHVSEQGGEFGPDACFECHNPHAPL
jgi:predicted CXXCH cytochrome family protein